MTPDQRVRTRALNDRLRKTGCGGRIMMTATLAARDERFIRRVVDTLRAFDAFGPAADPYSEHDSGSFCVDDELLFFKIDYYDPSFLRGADDPSSDACERVLTLMFASDY